MSDAYVQRITIDYNFEVHFLRGVFALDNPAFAHSISSLYPGGPHRILFLADHEIAQSLPMLARDISSYCSAHREVFLQSSEPVFLDGGESLKNFESVEALCRLLDSNRLCRQSFVGIIGGGAFLDAVGFAVSIVHRGLRQIRFPSTVLAQADSGVGLKNGINMFGKKNFIGSFAPPAAVFNDFDFLDSLEQRDWLAGVAEAFKVALIKDAAFFEWLCKEASAVARRSASVMEELIRRCAILHLDHIRNSGDPFEFGSARPLDFGHWSAHKLEMLSNNTLRHGEAVAIGITLDSFYAVQSGLLPQGILDKLVSALQDAGFYLWHDMLDSVLPSGKRAIFEGIAEFREHLGGELHITLPDGLGRKCEVSSLDEAIISKGIDFLRKFAK